MHIPARPGVVIRAPEREKSKEVKMNMDSGIGSGITQQVADKIASSSLGKPEFVVYTNNGVCPHSDDLVSLAQMRGLVFNKIDVSQTIPPNWLPGTPSVVCGGDVYCGDAALSFVEGFPVQTSPGDDNDTNLFNTDKESAGCGIKAAFAPPRHEDVDESKFNVSTEDMMQKLLAGRR